MVIFTTLRRYLKEDLLFSGRHLSPGWRNSKVKKGLIFQKWILIKLGIGWNTHTSHR